MLSKYLITTGGLVLSTAMVISAQAHFAKTLPVASGESVTECLPLKFPAKGSVNGQPARLGERNPLKPPFVETFENYPEGMEHDSFERNFEIINSNGDTNPSGSDRSWGFYNYSGESDGRVYSRCAYLQYPYQKPVCDDWLIPRAITFEAGKYYRVTVEASLYTAGTTHRFEVKMGEYNDAEGLNISVIEPVDVETIVPTQYEGWFVPGYDGIYYMGIHGISLKSLCEGGYLFMDNIAVEAARTGREPGRVTDIQFISDPNGTPSVDITFKAPVKSIADTELSGNVNIEVKRGDKVVKTLEALPGQLVTVNDAVAEPSLQTYTITTSNSDGQGCDVKVSQYIGMSTPLPPVFTSVTESSEGFVTLKWQAPATDVNGTAISPDIVTYNIYEVTVNGQELYCENYKGTEISLDLGLEPGEQKAVNFTITATVNNEVSAECASDVVFVGTPYALPYCNSFVDNNEADVVLATESDENVRWRMLDDFSDPKPQDGDGGYVGMIGTAPDEYGEMSTGKIDFTSVENGSLSFYTYVYDEDENVVSAFAVDCNTGERFSLGTFALTDFNGVGWRRVVLPIEGCGGRVIRIVLAGRIVSHTNILFDNMVIDSMPDVDLAITALSYSPQATIGEKYTVTATVTNYGSKSVESFKASLYCEDAVIATLEDGPLAPQQSTNMVLEGEFSATSAPMPSFWVKIDAAGDANQADNVSEPFNITFLAPIHPVVDTLAGEESSDGTVTLRWSAPDLSKAAPEEVLEDFESYPAFTTELNGFTMYDGDGGYPAGMSGLDMPVTNSKQAYWTMTGDVPYNFMSTIGNSSLVAMATVNSGGSAIANDDWLISPELYGGRQTINFWTCAQTVAYGYETFEVYASATDAKLSSFEKVLYETEVGEEWTNVFVSLPEGTRYFAIRCTSNDCMFFTLDNITYVPKGTPRSLELKGYNVYRNGVRQNEDLLTATSYVTSRDLEADHYFVTAVYDQGESTASNIVNFGLVGIDEIAAENADVPAKFYDLRGIQVDSSALTPGIYICRQGNRVSKIVVR